MLHFTAEKTEAQKRDAKVQWSLPQPGSFQVRLYRSFRQELASPGVGLVYRWGIRTTGVGT